MPPILIFAVIAGVGYWFYKRSHQYDTPLGKGAPVTVTTINPDGTTTTGTLPYVLDANMPAFNKGEFANLYDSLKVLDPGEALSLAIRSAGVYKDGGFPIASRLFVDVALRIADQETEGKAGYSPYRVGSQGAAIYSAPEEGSSPAIDPSMMDRVPPEWLASWGGIVLPPGTPVLLGNVTADGQWATIVLAFPPSASLPNGGTDEGYGRVSDFTFGI